jgi:dolichyl-phosphate beta-glucosyltransferase
VTDQPVDLSIILPAYMEAAGIADALDELAEFLGSRNYGQVEVLVVVADSTDGTAKIAESRAGKFANFRLIHAGPRAGKGRDVRLGMYEATGRYRLFMDADLATPLAHLDDVWQLMQQDVPVIIAVRNLWSIHKGLLRKFMSYFGNVVAQVLILPGIKDTQCGFKAFEASAAEDIFGRMTMLGWSFDAEVLKIARLRRYQIRTIEAPDWHDPKKAGMGLVGDSPLHAAIKTFEDLFVIRWNVWTGRYRRASYKHQSVY